MTLCPFHSTTFIISYGLQFAAFTSTLVHVFRKFPSSLIHLLSRTHVLVWYRKDITRQFKLSVRQEHDVHLRLMSVYSEVPGWWYGLLGVVAFVIGAIVIEVFHTGVSAVISSGYML